MNSKYICHIGPGFFHRSHQAFSIYRLKLLQPSEKHWFYRGVSLFPCDNTLSTFNALHRQNYQYIVNEHSNYKYGFHIVNSISGLDYLPNDPTLIQNYTTPQIKAVTATITEKGYCLKPSGKLDTNNSHIIQDIENPCFVTQQPYTVYGFLFHILNYRQQHNLPGFPILSCDNISNNSNQLYSGLIDFINHKNKSSLSQWIEQNCTFPNTMVDRITTNKNITNKRNDQEYHFGIECEPYLKWVIEDKFINKNNEILDFPPIHSLNNISLTDDIQTHEKMKLLLLNGTHSLISCLSDTSESTIYDIVTHPPYYKIICEYIDCILSLDCIFSKEEKQTLEIKKYVNDVMQRLHNKEINDFVSRIQLDNGKKIQTIFTPLFEQLHKEHKEDGLSVESIKHCFLPLHYYLQYLSRTYPLVNDHIGEQIQKYHTLKYKIHFLFGENSVSEWIYNVYNKIYIN